MKKISRRLSAIVLALLMVVSLIPASLSAVRAEEAASTTMTVHVDVSACGDTFAEGANIHYWGGTYNSNWPGDAMTADGTGRYVADIAAGSTGIIFNYNGIQTGNINIDVCSEVWVILDKDESGNLTSAVYYSDPDYVTVKVRNHTESSKLYFYYWGSSIKSINWSDSIELTDADKDGWFECAIPKDATSGIVQNGNGWQTGDLTLTAGVTNYLVVEENKTASITTTLPFVIGHIKDTKEWASVYAYACQGESWEKLTGEWPGEELTTKEYGWYTIELPLTVTWLILTDNNGNQTKNIEVREGADFWATTEGTIEYLNPDLTEEEEPVYTIHVLNNTDWQTLNIKYWGGTNACETEYGIDITSNETDEFGYTVVETPTDISGFLFNNGSWGTGNQTANINDPDTTKDIYIVIAEDATMTTSFLKPGYVTVTIVLNEAQTWEKVALYTWDSSIASMSWPGIEATATETAGVYTVEFPGDADTIIVDNNNNGEQTVNIDISKKPYNIDYTVTLTAEADDQGHYYAEVSYQELSEEEKEAAEKAKEEAAAKKEAEEAAKIAEAMSDSYTVYAKFDSTWENPTYWAWSSEGNLFSAWPGQAISDSDGDGWYEATLPKAETGFLFAANAGSIQTGDITPPGSATYYVVGADGSYTAYDSNPDAMSEAEKEAAAKAAEEKAAAEKAAAEAAAKAAMEEKLSGNSFAVYVQVPASWQNPTYYTWGGDNGELMAWPGASMTLSGSWYVAAMPNGNTNFIVAANDGTTQTKDLTVTGTCYVVVGEDASVVISDTEPNVAEVQEKLAQAAAEKAAKMADTFTVHVKVDSSWSNPCWYAWNNDGDQVKAWPGTTLGSANAEGWYTVEVPKLMTGFIVNGNDGAIQTKDITVNGTEIWIEVDKDGGYTITDASGNTTTGDSNVVTYAEAPEGIDYVTLYVKAPADWGVARLWAWGEEGNLYDSWPGEALVEEGEWLVATLPIWVTAIIINGNDGAVQTSDIIIERGKDIWLVVNGAGDDYEITYTDVVAHEEVTPEEVVTSASSVDDDTDDVDVDDEVTEEETPKAAAATEDSNSVLPQVIIFIVIALGVAIIAVSVVTVVRKKNVANK